MKNNYFFISSNIGDIKLCKFQGGGPDPPPSTPPLDPRMNSDKLKWVYGNVEVFKNQLHFIMRSVFILKFFETGQLRDNALKFFKFLFTISEYLLLSFCHTPRGFVLFLHHYWPVLCTGNLQPNQSAVSIQVLVNTYKTMCYHHKSQLMLNSLDRIN